MDLLAGVRQLASFTPGCQRPRHPAGQRTPSLLKVQIRNPRTGWEKSGARVTF